MQCVPQIEPIHNIPAMLVFVGFVTFFLVFSSSVTMKSKSNKEDAIWQKIFENIIVLSNEYKTAVLLTYFSKSGQVFFGPSNVTCKMRKSYNCTCNCTCEVDNDVSWEAVIFTFNRELISGSQIMEIDLTGEESIVMKVRSASMCNSIHELPPVC